MSAGLRPARARAPSMASRRRGLPDGGGHVVGVAGFAVAWQQQRVVGVEAVGGALQQAEGGGLADGDAAGARGVVGAAGLGRGELEGGKAVQGGEAQAVDAPTSAASIRPRVDQPRRRRVGLGGRGAGRGHDVAGLRWPASCYEVGQGIGAGCPVVQPGGQGPPSGALAVGQLGAEDARGAGAQTIPARRAPWRAMRLRMASSKPSAARPRRASRLLRQSKPAMEAGRRHRRGAPGLRRSRCRCPALDAVGAQAAGAVAEGCAQRCQAIACTAARCDGQGGVVSRCSLFGR
jgi:hypothetical protein